MEASFVEEDCESEAMFDVGIIPHGVAEELWNRPVYLHCSRCSRWLVGWGTRCAL